MAIQNDSENETPQGTVRTSVKPAETTEASEVVGAFNDEYLKYYGMYSEVRDLEEFVENEMLEDLDAGEEVPEEFLWTVRNQDNNDFIGAGALKFHDNIAELGSTIIVPEYRGQRTETENGDKGIYDMLFDHRMDEVEELVAEGHVDIVNTQLLADESAATQHTADKYDFAVTGVYNRKFPVAYEGKGRVTVVDMVWADSRIENSLDEVYVPEEATEIVETTIDNINSKRSRGKEEIIRSPALADEDRRSQKYSVNAKAVDKPEDDPMNFAEVSIVADDSGDYNWDDVINEIEEAEEKIENSENDYWVGVSLDLNTEAAVDAATALEEFGFEYAGFNPGKLEAEGDKRDSLEMQRYPIDDKTQKEFIHEAKDMIEAADIDYNELEYKTDHSSSQALEV